VVRANSIQQRDCIDRSLSVMAARCGRSAENADQQQDDQDEYDCADTDVHSLFSFVG
jgi:hypothetical protein